MQLTNRDSNRSLGKKWSNVPDGASFCGISFLGLSLWPICVTENHSATTCPHAPIQLLEKHRTTNKTEGS